jgi:hypothetical protein
MLAQSDVRVSQGVGCVTQPTLSVVGGIPIRDAVAISRRETIDSKCFTTVRSLREGEGFVVEADLCDGSWVSTVPLPPHQPLEVMGVWNAGPVASPPPKEGVYQGVVNTAPVDSRFFLCRKTRPREAVTRRAEGAACVVRSTSRLSGNSSTRWRRA